MSDLLNVNNVFLAIAAASTLIYIIKMCFYFFAGDIDLETSFNDITATDVSFDFLSFQSVLAFLMGFGWMGYSALVQFKTGIFITCLIALASGIFFLYVSAYLMFCVKKMAKTVKFDLNDLIGKSGRAYTAFEAKSKGQIEIDFNGRLSVLAAYNSTDEEIGAFTSVKVEKIEDNTIYIRKE